MIKRSLVRLLIVLLAAPSAVFAQATKAGVVTTLEGNVSARRVALPSPVPLKFKDDVLLQDTITTGDKSLARMLLGGKAVVTVRERSVLTITEVPGRTSIDLDSGKFALAVAREKMRPGEEIQIRTPNAVAGVRGTVVITEVERQGAQVGTAVPAVVTNFFVLRGEITAQRLDAARNPFGAPFQIGTMQSFSGAGLATPRVQPVLAEQIARITSGLQPTGRKAGGDAGKEQVKAQQQQAAVALLGALTGDSQLAGGSQLMRGSSTLAFQTSSTGYEGGPLYSSFTDNCAIESCNLQSLLVDTFNVPDFDTDLTSDSGFPLFQFTNKSFTKSTSFFKVGKTGKVKLAGPLANFVDTAVLTGGSLLDVGGLLTSTGTTALIALDPSFIGAAQNVVTLDGGTLTLAGPLITDTSGIIVSLQEFLKMINNASLTNTGSGALVQLDGTSVFGTAALNMTSSTMTLAGPLVTATDVGTVDSSVFAAALQALGLTIGPAASTFLLSSSMLTSTGTGALIQLNNSDFDQDLDFIRLVNGSSMTLAGPLLSVTSSVIDTDRSLLEVSNAATLTNTGSSPLIQLDGTTIDVDGNLIIVSGSGATLTLAGPLLKDVGGTVATGGTDTRSFLVIHDSAVVKDTSSEPFISLTSSTVTSVGSFLSLRRSGSTPSRLELAGPFLVTSGGSLTFKSTVLLDQNGLPRLCCGLFGVGQGAVFTSTTTSPLISLAGTSLTVGQNVLVFFDTTSIFGEPTITAAASATLKGPLFKATGSTSVSGLSDFLGIFRSSVSSTTTEPFLDLNGTSVSMGGTSPIDGSTTAGRFVNISANSTTPSSLALQGPLLNATNAIISTTDDAFGVFNGATLVSTTTSPLIGISGGSVTTGLNGNFFAVASGSGLPGTAVTLAGPLLQATGAALSNGVPTSNVVSFLFIGDGSQVSSTSTSPFMSFASSSVDSASDMLSLRRSTATTPTRLTLAGPLLTATNSTFNTTSLGFGSAFGTAPSACCSTFFVGQGAQLSSTTGSALIQLTSSTVTGNDAQSGGTFFLIADSFGGAPASELVASSSVSLAGPLLGATSSTITSLFDLVQVRRSSLSSTTTSALISLSGGTVTLGGTNPIDGTTAFGTLLRVFSSSTSGTVASPASISLAGPVLSMSGGTLTKNGNILGVINGATFTSTTTSPLISISNGATVAGSTPSGFSGAFLSISGVGGASGTASATATFGGPLLNVTGGTLNMPRDLFLGAIAGGTVIANDPTQPFVSLSGGTHTVGSVAFTQLFRITGINTALDTDTNITAPPLSGSITVGTDQPLQRSGSGAFLSLSNGATLNTQQALTLDTALLSASAPLLSLSGGSSLTTASDAINLVQKAKFTSTASLLSINASALTINGHAVRVAGGSGLVTGNLFSVSGGGTLNINGGAALFVSGGSIVNITGALVNFGANNQGNQVNISNNLCSPSCFTTSTTPVLNVQLQGGATSSQVIGAIGTAVNNPTGNTFSVGASDAVIVIDGTTAKVKLP